MFRIWPSRSAEPTRNGGKNGVFDPPQEAFWEHHGSVILTATVEGTDMLPCAEDLGVVPACSGKTLRRYGIPGTEIQRWMSSRTGGRIRICEPEEYRHCSIATASTHDMSPVLSWWTSLKSDEAGVFRRYLRLKPGESARPARVAEAVLRKIHSASSIFSIQLIHDWMALEAPRFIRSSSTPVNRPGTVSSNNWSWVSPVSLESMMTLPSNRQIAALNREAGR
ncbi:MAG: 4-alpha-glucanotransferase, partial [Candidatus Omnitrophica bacterium]|nr:4-alpha-glucanotransferase [Candidatus Omnitrophota bacterium]